MVLLLRRHAIGPMSMNEQEAAGFGPLVSRVSTAVNDLLSPERVYVVGFGENFPHWHVLIANRGPEIPPTDRGGNLLGNHSSLIDPQRSAEVAVQVRELLTD